MRMTTIASLALALALCARTHVNAFSMAMSASETQSSSSRRGFLSSAAAAAAAVCVVQPAMAAPTVYNLPNGVKYAVTQDVAKGSYPQPGDIIAIEYTGYLSNGAIFDATHSQGKKNALLFKLGSTAVNDGINSMVAEMKVGQKVQAIIPPELAFGDKGICLESGECLVKPGATLVYDIFLKKASIPPP